MVGETSGAGKTTFEVQFLVQGAKVGERGMYVSLIEDPKNIIADLGGFNFGLVEHVNEGRIIFLDFGKSLKEGMEFPTVIQLFAKIKDVATLKNIK